MSRNVAEQKQQNQFDPLSDVKEYLKKLYSKGHLPVATIGLVMLINLFSFSYPAGYSFYLIVPLVASFGLFLTSYWEFDLSQRSIGERKIVYAILALFLSAGVDLVVSLSYVIGSKSIRNMAFLTLILDIIAIVAFVGWFRDWNTT